MPESADPTAVREDDSFPEMVLSVNHARAANGRPVLDVTTMQDSHRRQIARMMGVPWEMVTDVQVPPQSIPDKPTTAMLRAMETPELAPENSKAARQALAIEVEDLLGYTPLRKDAGAPSKLQRILAELEITAFDPMSVTEYKERMRLHFQAIAIQRDQEQMREIVSANPGISLHFIPRIRTRVTWAYIGLSEYTKPIPEFVLNKAMQIKRREPSAEFFVDELRENTTRTLDPFLVVRIGSDEAAIEVWDEPEFEKTL